MTERIDFIFKDETIHLTQSAGFFSCCSVRLDAIIQYYKRYGKLPHKVDSTQQYRLYKLPGQENTDITREFFLDPEDVSVEIRETPNYRENFQGLNYRAQINYAPILPFVQKYFSPNAEIMDAVAHFEQKYDIDYNNTCVLFYRGLDKVTEFPLPTYRDVFARARKIANKHSGSKLRFLIQSDEADFIDAALVEFPGAIVFRDETRALPRQNTSVDLFYRDKLEHRDKLENFYYAKLFFAIVLIMGRARYFVCNTGNISIWTCFYRGGADENVHQYLNWGYCN